MQSRDGEALAREMSVTDLVVDSASQWRRGVLGVVAGLIAGGFAAWAYYDDFFRPLAHSFGLWIVVVALLSARQPARWAIGQSCLCLSAAVISFYVGKKIMYGIDYPGMPYSINASVLMEWLALAVIAGIALGAVFSWSGQPGGKGALGTAAAVGLLIGDAYRRSAIHDSEATVLGAFAVLGIVAVLGSTVRSWSQLALVGVLLLPCAPVGYLLVSAPDLLEQFLITGSFQMIHHSEV